MLAKIEELKEFCELDDYVRTKKTGRETYRKLAVDFYDYLKMNDKKYRKLQSVLYEKQYCDYPFERQLEIAKFLHHPKTPAEIQEHFDIDQRTMSKDLQELEGGITVLGSTIQMEKEKKGRSYYYKTTLHPVFLPLNLTEVYALTVYLNHAIGDRDPNAEIIREITGRVKSQLSDYAFAKLFPDEIEERPMNHYIDDEKLARERKDICSYLMKSGQWCTFYWQEYRSFLLFVV